MYHSVLSPNFGFHWLTAFEEINDITPNGRPITSGYREIGKIFGMVKRASSSTIGQWKARADWKQELHAISHEIIQQGSKIRLKPTDVIVYDNRKFVVKGAHDYVDCGHFMLYYVEERMDLQ